MKTFTKIVVAAIIMLCATAAQAQNQTAVNISTNFFGLRGTVTVEWIRTQGGADTPIPCGLPQYISMGMNSHITLSFEFPATPGDADDISKTRLYITTNEVKRLLQERSGFAFEMNYLYDGSKAFGELGPIPANPPIGDN